MTHTPGPWRQSDNELGYENSDILADTGLGMPNTGIATVIDARFSDYKLGTVALHREVCEANARLIAAAPEMLDALKEIAKGEGPYSRNRLTHAESTIAHMVLIASQALAEGKDSEEE